MGNTTRSRARRSTDRSIDDRADRGGGEAGRRRREKENRERAFQRGRARTCVYAKCLRMQRDLAEVNKISERRILDDIKLPVITDRKLKLIYGRHFRIR